VLGCTSNLELKVGRVKIVDKQVGHLFFLAVKDPPE
jgi:hypothetical protein